MVAPSTGNTIPKRGLQIIDKTGETDMQVWYSDATDCKAKKGDVILCTGAQVNEFKGIEQLFSDL